MGAPGSSAPLLCGFACPFEWCVPLSGVCPQGMQAAGRNPPGAVGSVLLSTPAADAPILSSTARCPPPTPAVSPESPWGAAEKEFHTFPQMLLASV